MNNPTEISLEAHENIRATIDAIIKKNNYTANPATIPGATVRRTDDPTFNSAVKDDRLPDMERITQSLRKVQEITAAAHLIWQDEKTAKRITGDAIKIINQVCKKKFSFGMGKSFRCIVGGLFYLLGFRHNDPKKQREIAIGLQITEVSIRSAYKNWLKEFPDLFQDETKKLSHQKLRGNHYPITRQQTQIILTGRWKNEDE